jgi:hypothetical protein
MKILSMFLTVALVMALLLTAVPAFAEEGGGLKVSGEAKSGVYWQKTQDQGAEPEAEVTMRNRDGDSGDGQGRFRLNLDYDNGNNFGMRARIDWHTWSDPYPDRWSYAYGYGNFFSNQMTVSVGKLGGSPWGSGGPEMWKELEQTTQAGGMRVEWKPAFIPEKYGKLNAGFVLNYFNADRDQGDQDIKVNLVAVLRESVIGVSYTHDVGLIRFAYRLDSNIDGVQGNKDGPDRGKGEDEFVYRVEERVLTRYLPGFQIWALGHLQGIFDVHNEDVRWYRNWFFTQYDPPELFGLSTPFTAQIRLGHEKILSRDIILIKPSFYWHFSIGEHQKLISVGAAYTWTQDFGEGRIDGDHPYYYMEIEPKVQLNFTSSYIAFVYNWRREYFHDYLKVEGYDPIRQIQYMNLRFGIYF